MSRDKAGPTPPALLFVCGRNAIRSPMAEALARQILPASSFIGSAGVRQGERDPFVDAVLAEIGLSLGERRPRTLDELDVGSFQTIVTLSPEAHHIALEKTRGMSVDVEYWPTLDPSVIEGSREQIMTSYRFVREKLAEQIASRFGFSASPNGE